MTITSIFFALGILGFLLAVVAILIAMKKVKKEKRGAPIGVSILTILLFIGTLVNAIISFSLIAEDYYYEYYDYTPAVGWVTLGLGCGAIVFGLISIIVVFIAMNSKDQEMVASENEPIINGNVVLLSASANVGVGFFTGAICLPWSAFLGVECKNYTKKMERASNAVKERLLRQMSNYPDFKFSDFRIVKEGGLTYTGTVIGTREQ